MDNRNDFDMIEWAKSILNEIEEFDSKIRNHIGKKNIDGIDELSLYKLMVNHIIKDKDDENIIFFILFSIIKESSTTIFSQFACDILSSIYDKIESEKILFGRKLYVLYFGMDNEIVIRCLNSNIREYFSASIFNEIISFQINQL